MRKPSERSCSICGKVFLHTHYKTCSDICRSEARRIGGKIGVAYVLTEEAKARAREARKRPARYSKCKICGVEFCMRHTWPTFKQATCSKECLAMHLKTMNVGRSVPQNQRDKIRETLLRKGIKPPRKAIDLSREALKRPEVRAKMKIVTPAKRASIRNLIAFNTGRKRSAQEVQAVVNANRKSEKFKAHLVRMSKLGQEAIKNDPRFQKGPQNISSKYWHFRSPSGSEHHFKNLRHFISENPHFFDKQDVEWKEVVRFKHGRAYKVLKCKALALARLRPSKFSKRQLGAWKGWMWVSKTENHADLLERKISSL